MPEHRISVPTLSLSIAVALTLGSSAALADDGYTLMSKTTDADISIDGTVDAAWEAAPVLSVTLDRMPYQPDNGYPGMTATEVQMRSLHDGEYIYLLMQYADPTESLERFPWIKQADGSWKQNVNKDSTGHENTYYEDKIGMFWDINARGFAKKGCDVACHMAVNGQVNGIDDTSAGRKYTREGEFIDMWHWKGVRSNPVGQADDQYVHSNTDPSVNRNWGRSGDSKTGGGYKNNVNDDKSGPAYMVLSEADMHKYFIIAGTETPFEDTFDVGAVVPGIIVSPFEGSRGDIAATGVWADGMWTVELKRRLVTEGDNVAEQDVQFDDLGETYDFGISVFDNSQINHLYHSGSLTLQFD